MLKGYVTVLEKNKRISFIIDENSRIILNNNEDPFLLLSKKTIQKDIVNGRLNDGRHIRFFNCFYNGFSLSAQGYIYSKGNIDPSKLQKFHRIYFTGRSINIFSGACADVMKHLKNESSYDEQMFGITPRPWKDIDQEYNVTVNNIPCKIGISHYISYNADWGNTSIGNCTPRFYIAFAKPVPISMIPQLYLWAYDFFKFISFRRNIEFDKIAISQIHPDTKKFEDIGFVSIFTEAKMPYSNTHSNTILLRDIGDNCGKLFAYIANRRNFNTTDDLFIPQNDRDFRTMNYTNFLECALSFEGEFDRTQSTKTDTNPLFGQIKKIAQDSVANVTCNLIESNEETSIGAELLEGVKSDFYAQIENLCAETSNAKIRSIKKYSFKFMDAIDKIDYSLEEQYNHVCKKYDNIIRDYKKELAKRMNINLSDYNLGSEFSSLRNQIGHGHPGKIENIHLFVFMLGRCLIYTMILKSIGIDDIETKTIINKLF